MKSNHLLLIVAGIIIGALWYRLGERFDQKKLSTKCWEILHYHHKERLPLVIVHLKSVLAGLALILVAVTDYKHKDAGIILIGSAIIGLHIYQYINEQQIIKTRERFFHTI